MVPGLRTGTWRLESLPPMDLEILQNGLIRLIVHLVSDLELLKKGPQSDKFVAKKNQNLSQSVRPMSGLLNL